MRLSLKTAPAAAALDWTTEVMEHLRLDSSEEQGRVMTILVPAAQQWAESATGRQLVTATWTLFLSSFPGDSSCPIWLPKPPLQSVTSVKYYDGAGVLQTWAASNYSYVAPAGPKCGGGYILPKAGAFYPSVYGSPYEVEIEFVAGYGATFAAVPGLLKAGMLLLVGEQFERREESVSGTIINRVPMNAASLILPFLWEHPYAGR